MVHGLDSVPDFVSKETAPLTAPALKDLPKSTSEAHPSSNVAVANSSDAPGAEPPMDVAPIGPLLQEHIEAASISSLSQPPAANHLHAVPVGLAPTSSNSTPQRVEISQLNKTAVDAQMQVSPIIDPSTALRKVTASSSVQQVLIGPDQPIVKDLSTSQKFLSPTQLVSVTPYPKRLQPNASLNNLDGGGVSAMQQPLSIPSPPSLHVPQSGNTASLQGKSHVTSLAMVISSNLDDPSVSKELRAGNQYSSPTCQLNDQQVNEATQLISLNPYALDFQLPSSASKERKSATQPLKEHTIADNTMGYLDNASYGDSFESDKTVDEDEDAEWSSAYGLTDGSEGTIRQKRRDRRKSKGQTLIRSVTKDELQEQARILGKAIKKKGRPPGSRNRTYFDVVRTMTTRNTKSTSD